LIGLGSGNAPQSVLRACVDRFRSDPKPLILGCSQAEGDRKNPSAYKHVGIASLAEEGFSVWSQGEYPLEFVHALGAFALLGAPEDPSAVLDRYLRRSPAP
ncbi:MAG TPA: asparaginase, partial [Synergistaceae bacterium]|nr:asparaginase [Synergistaceae bacterium]